MTFLLKACPRCHGDVYVERDIAGDINLVCLQCSHELRGTERADALARLYEAQRLAPERRRREPAAVRRAA